MKTINQIHLNEEKIIGVGDLLDIVLQDFVL